jgi:GTPase SAR1 family protein
MKEQLADIRKVLSRAHSNLQGLDQQIHEHHRADSEICRRYSDYLTVSPGSYLDRAGELLGKSYYRVAFCGPFSCGKSTLINALLQDPGLLPSAAGECTLSITNLAKPRPGKGEQVEIHYFTKEDALRNIFTNIRYKALFGKEADRLLGEFSIQTALTTIAEESEASNQGRCETDLSLPELMKRRAELKEFSVELKAKEDQNKLGSIFYDSVSQSDQYLTTDHDGKGMGHLLLIQMVNIYKENVLFAQDGIQVIDLPGTDSINERQRELTHSYLHEADVVINVLEPRGFSAADKAIESVVRGATISSIKNKMFFVVNRFDTLHAKDMDEKGKLKRLVDGQIRTEIARSGLNSDWLYMTSALWAELNAQKHLSDTDRATLKSLETNGEERLKQLRGLGELADLPTLLRDRITECYENGGVDKFRSDLLRYLKQDIEQQRLLEIKTYLDRVLGHLNHMLLPERDGVQEILASTRHRVRQVGEFLDRVQYDTRGAFREVEELLEANDQKRFQSRLMKINRKFEAMVEESLSADRPGLDFRDIADSVGMSNPQAIMKGIVDASKSYFSSQFIDMVTSELSPSFSELTLDKLTGCGNEAIFGHFSKVLRDNNSFLDHYTQLKEQFERDIRELTRKRSTEETWIVADLDLVPDAKKRNWSDDVSARFRKTYTTVFKDVFRDRFKALSAVMLRYYKLALVDFMNGFEESLASMREEARYENMTIPVELFEHKSDLETLRKYKIVDYLTTVEGVKGKLQEVSGPLEEA